MLARTIRKSIFVFFATTLLIFLTSCKSEIEVELFASDIFSSENLIVPVVMAIEVPSCKSERLQAQTTSFLAVFSESSQAESIGCENKGINSFLSFKLKGEIANKTASHDIVLFRSVADDGVTDMSASLSSNFLTRLNSLAESKMQRIDSDDFTLTIKIQNDLRDVVRVHGAGWFDGTPAQGRNIDLGHRDTISLKLSNLASAILINEGQPKIFFSHKVNAPAESS